MATVESYDDPRSTGKKFIITLERELDPAVAAGILREAIADAAKQFAATWIDENRDKIIARLNVDAIANMIMLEVANDIKKDARKGNE